MTELKPCPFCGCDVSFYRDKSGWNKVLGNHGDICPLQGSNLLTWSEKEDAPIIEKWNTRTSPWISVKEQLPPAGNACVFYRPLADKSGDRVIAVKTATKDNKNCWKDTVPDGDEPCNPSDGCCHVTHWMIVEPPKECSK